MADAKDIAAIVSIASDMLPSIVGLVQAFRHQADPNAPTVTDTEVLAALHEAVAQSLAKDDLWLSQHPRD